MERVRAGLEALGIGGSDEQAERDRQLADGSRLAEEQAARMDAERRGTEEAAQLRADMAQGRVDVFDAGVRVLVVWCCEKPRVCYTPIGLMISAIRPPWK